jgi:hypothetical protein
MTAATLDLATWADGQLDGDQPLQQLADAVAALWSAGTGLALQPVAVALDDTHARVVLAEPWSSGEREEAPEALLCRLDRPFGRHAHDLVRVLEPRARDLLGRSLTHMNAQHHREQGRVVVELSLTQA